MDEWEEKLLERARDIRKHGHGELNMIVSTHKQLTKIMIKAGEAWLFFVESAENEGGKSQHSL